jgi:hypothetical protein
MAVWGAAGAVCSVWAPPAGEKRKGDRISVAFSRPRDAQANCVSLAKETYSLVVKKTLPDALSPAPALGFTVATMGLLA